MKTNWIHFCAFIIFTLAALVSHSQWGFFQELTASDFELNDRFGISTHVNGTRCVIGADQDDDAIGGDNCCPNAGSAYIFEFDGVQWVQMQKLLASNGTSNQFFGYCVAIEDDLCAIGCVGTGFYIFEYDGANWVETFTNGAFGISDIDISNDRIIVNGPSGTGIYHYNGSTWVFSYLGFSGSEGVTIEGNRAAVGTTSGGNHVEIYEYDGFTWNQVHEIVPGIDLPAGSDLNTFGKSLELEGNRLAIAHPAFFEGVNVYNGRVSIFDFDGLNWGHTEDIFGLNAVEYMGTSLELSGNTILTSAQPSSDVARFWVDDGVNWNQDIFAATQISAGPAFQGTELGLDGPWASVGYGVNSTTTMYLFGSNGCTDPTACNYNGAATIDDGSCTYAGCQDHLACNFDPLAGCPALCDYSCIGCTYPSACNYDAANTIDDGSCDFISCVSPGCTYEDALNYDPTATFDDGSCILPFTCQGDITLDLVIDTNDLLLFLAFFGTSCP